MQILVNDDIDPSLWERLLIHSPNVSPFQTYRYFEFLNNTRGVDGIAIALLASRQIKAIAVITVMKESGAFKYFSRRGIIFGGPVLNDISDEECSFFFQEINKNLMGKVIYLESRNLFDYSNFIKPLQRANWNYIPHLNIQLSLKGLTKESLLGVFDNDVRRRLKNSLSEGAIYKECNSESELIAVYAILNDLYNTKVKLPLPDFNFFSELFNYGLMKVFVVEHQGNILGGSFCPYDKNGIYTFYYCDRKDYHRRISPTHLSIVAAMEYGIENGIPKFDFMGAGKPGIPFGVRDFKKQFGGIQVEYGRFTNILNPCLYNLGKLGIKILSRFR